MPAAIRIRPLPFKPPRLKGLSERLLASHYVNNYGGAVRRLNAIAAELAALDWSSAPGFRVNGLKREQLIAMNSALLHEAYFDALGPADPTSGAQASGALAEALTRDFGSIAAWRAEFMAMGRALGGGSGWVLLTYSARFNRLINQWAADHTHALAEGFPVLALDMYEHAYHMDFGANAAAYVEAFMANIAWDRVGHRYHDALLGAEVEKPLPPDEIAPEQLAVQRAGVTLLDVRLPEDYAKGTHAIAGAAYCAPTDLDAWAAKQDKSKPVVAYCVYGFQVSREAVAALRRAGLKAQALSGGIAAWQAIGGAVQPKEAQP